MFVLSGSCFLLPPQVPRFLVAVLLKADGRTRLTIGIFSRHLDVMFLAHNYKRNLTAGVILFLTALYSGSSSTRIVKPPGMLSVQAEIETDEVLSPSDAPDDPAICISPNGLN